MLYIIGYLLIFFSILVILLANPISALLSLAVVYLISAVLLLVLHLEFLALIIIIIYLGALLILFLFILMLSNIKEIKLNFNNI